MQLKEAYLERAVGEVEDVAARVAMLKTRFARQKVNVKLEHYWELEYVRTCFTQFKRLSRPLKMPRTQKLTVPASRGNGLEGFDSRCGDASRRATVRRGRSDSRPMARRREGEKLGLNGSQ